MQLSHLIKFRCGDHAPSDGIGAHKMVLSAASPAFLKPALVCPDLGGDGEELACVHLPDFASSEVGCHLIQI